MTERAMLRVEDVAPLLGVSKARVYQLIRDGFLPHVSLGGAIVIPRPAWHEWLEEQTKAALANISNGKPKPEPKVKPAAKSKKAKKARARVVAALKAEAKRGPVGPVITRLERGVSRREVG